MVLRRQSGAAFLIALLLASFVGAQEQQQISTTLVAGPRFPPGRWVPLRVTIRNPTPETVAGTLELSMKTEAGAYDLLRSVHVPSHSRVVADLLATFAAPPPRRPKQEKTDPVGEIRWRGTHGGIVAREPIYAIADTQSLGETAGGDMPGVIALNIYGADVASDMFEPTELQSTLSEGAGYPVSMATVGPIVLMRRSVSYDAARLVVIDGIAVEQLDAAQRDALLQHVRSGATLLVSGNAPSLASSWLGPMLPLDVVGAREVSEIATDAYGKIRFTRPAPVDETIARPGATVVASASFGPVAAYRELGFGRIAMVAIPVNAAAKDQVEVPRFWTALLGLNRPTFHDPKLFMSSMSEPEAPAQPVGDSARNTPVDRSVFGVLRAMVGETAPPWRTAAIISGIYTAGVAGVLLVVGAKRRPVALLACVGGGVLLAGGVLAFAGLRTANDPLLVARYSTVDLSDGTARRDEYVAFFGQQRNADISFTLPASATPRALIAAGAETPKVTMFPFSVDRVSASTGNLSSVWQIRSFDNNAPRLDAKISFDETGARLATDSALGGALEMPRLVIGTSVFPLSTIGTGAASSVVGSVNPTGTWTGGGGIIADEQTKLRTDILIRAESRTPSSAGQQMTSRSTDMRLIGFGAADESPLELKESVMRKTQTLIRTPVEIVPPSVGQSVLIPAGFTQVRRDASLSLPYTDSTGEWNESAQSGPWLIALAPPPGVGKLDVKQIAIDLDLRSPGYEVSLHRGQVRGGKVRENLAGEVVVQARGSGLQQTTAQISPEDVDANGWVWLLLNAKPPAAPTGLLAGEDSGQTTWRILRFDVSLTGVVSGPAQPIVVTWPRADVPTEQKPQPKPDPKKPDAKKPDPKKAEPKKPDAKKSETKKNDPKPQDTKKP